VFDYEELLKGDKVSLHIFWPTDKSLEESDDLQEPTVLVQEIADDMQAALEHFSAIAEKLRGLVTSNVPVPRLGSFFQRW
jgi:type I restriction enzyme M protein